MQSIRVKLYLLVAGLFDQPEDACADFHFSLIAKLRQSIPPQWPCRATLEALEREIVEDRHSPAELNAEYEHLFAPGGRVSPSSASWLPAAAIDEAQRLMARHGLAGDKAPDLIGELEFMAYLIADDSATRQLQRHFLQRHLGRWIPYFSQAVRFAAHLPRYRLAAELLEQVVIGDIAWLNSDSDERSSPHLRVA